MHQDAEELLIDWRLAHEGAPAYEELLHEDARVIVPGAVLDREECIAAIRASKPWREAALTLLWHRTTGDGWIVAYRFQGQRDEVYSAVMSSLYVYTDQGSRLLLHQQTPVIDSTGDLE
ncbi:DUF4440 domain-containing protein [Microbacterium oxydans]|uniref:DUF4440 domain-containing protein n=1 Tax=Microbacterium oxydans TaxID=82380 RepID=UPI003640C3CA